MNLSYRINKLEEKVKVTKETDPQAERLRALRKEKVANLYKQEALKCQEKVDLLLSQGIKDIPKAVSLLKDVDSCLNKSLSWLSKEILLSLQQQQKSLVEALNRTNKNWQTLYYK